MKITRTSLMYALLDEDYLRTIKVLMPDTLDKMEEFYGHEVIQKLKDSGLYSTDDVYLGEEGYVVRYNLSANIFETMPGVTDEHELPEFIAGYFKENGMWPMVKTPDEIARYSLDVALPLFVKAGLLETTQ